MFHVEMSENMMLECWHFLKDHNMGKRKEFNGTKEQQFVGILAESLVRDGFGLPRRLIEDCDDGYDLMLGTVKCDVKAVGRTTAPRAYYSNPVPESQLGYKSDVYIFASVNKKARMLTVCGWLPKDEFMDRAKYYPKGCTRQRSDGTTWIQESNLYDVLNEQLYPANSFDGLANDIMVLSV